MPGRKHNAMTEAGRRAVQEQEVREFLQQRQREIFGQNALYFDSLVAESAKTWDINALVTQNDKDVTWSPSLSAELDEQRDRTMNRTIWHLRNANVDYSKSDREFARDFYPVLLDRTESAILGGLRGRLMLALERNEKIDSFADTLRVLPVNNPDTLSEEVDFWREHAIQTLEYAKKGISGYVTEDLVEQTAGIFAVLGAGTKLKVKDTTIGHYKLGMMHGLYEHAKSKGDTTRAMLIDELSQLSFHDGRKPYSIAERVQTGRRERIERTQTPAMKAAVAENIIRQNSSHSTIKRSVAAAGVGVVAGLSINAPAAAAATVPNSSPYSPSNIHLETVMAAARGVGIVGATSPDMFVGPEMIPVRATIVGTASATPNMAVQAAVEAVQASLQPATLAGLEAVKVVEAPKLDASANPKDTIKSRIAAIAMTSGPRAAAALIVEQARADQAVSPGKSNEKYIKNPLFAEQLNKLVEVEMQSMSTSEVLTSDDAVINQLYLASLIAAAENPDSLDQLEENAKKAILDGLLTESPEAMHKLAEKIWHGLNTVEYGSWAGYTADQQKLITAMLATIDTSMMTSEQLAVLAPPRPEAQAAPEANTSSADRINVNEAEVKTGQRKAAIRELRQFGVPSDEIAGYYIDFAAKYKVPLELLVAQGKAESGFRDDVITGRFINHVGAQGIAQFMPATWNEWKADLGFPDEATPFQPRYAIEAQAAMMKAGLRKAKGDVPLALAGYNAGWGNVARYGGIPPFDETRGYISRITKSMKSLGNDIDTAEKKVRNAAEQEVRDTNARAEAAQKAAAAEAAKKAAAERERQARETPSRSQERDSNVKIIDGPVSKYGFGAPLGPEVFAKAPVTAGLDGYSNGFEERYLNANGVRPHHDGVDWGVREEEVISVRKGVVTHVGPYRPGNPIQLVVVDHGMVELDGETYHIMTNYEHVKENSFQVEEGDQVALGQVLAISSDSGSPGAYHVHVTLIKNDPNKDGRVGVTNPDWKAQTLDPQKYFPDVKDAKQWLQTH